MGDKKKILELQKGKTSEPIQTLVVRDEINIQVNKTRRTKYGYFQSHYQLQSQWQFIPYCQTGDDYPKLYPDTKEKVEKRCKRQVRNMDANVDKMLESMSKEFKRKSKPKISFAMITLIAIFLFSQLAGVSNAKELTGEGIEDIVPQKVVTHYDCDRPTETILYSTTEVPTCKLDLVDVEYAKTQVVTYYRSFAKRVDAWQCSISYQHDRWYCGVGSKSGIDASHVSITTPLALTGTQCKMVIPDTEFEVTTLSYVGLWGTKEFKIKFQQDVLTRTVQTVGQPVKEFKTAGEDCIGWGYINRFSFTTQIVKITLNYEIKTGKVMDITSMVLPCKFDEGMCDANNINHKAYVWKDNENCILAKIEALETQMVKWKDRYFLINDPTRNITVSIDKKYEANHWSGTLRDPITTTDMHTQKDMQFKFEIYPGPEKLCTQVDYLVHTTNYDSLYVRILQGGFNMATGKVTEYDKYMVQNNYITISTDPGHNVTSPYLDYVLNSNLKLDFVIHKNTQLIRQQGIEIIKQICEMERLNLLSILQTARIDPSTAGFLLTGNHSKYLETEGALAWLYTCIKQMSPFQKQTKCYDHIPVMYKGKTHFINTVTRKSQIPLLVTEISCKLAQDYIYHFDIEDEKSWYQILPHLHQHDAPRKFAPRDIKLITPFHTFVGSQAGVFTYKQVTNFYTRLMLSQTEDGIMKKMITQMVQDKFMRNGKLVYPDWGGQTQRIYIDGMISSNYFEDKFKATFGIIQFWVEKLGSAFAFVLFLKLVVEIISAFVRGFEIHKFTKRSTNIGKVIFSAVFNVFYLTAITKVFSEEMEGKYAGYGEMEELVANEDRAQLRREKEKKKEDKRRLKQEKKDRKNRKPPPNNPPAIPEKTYDIPKEFIHPRGITMETAMPSYMEMEERIKREKQIEKLYPPLPPPKDGIYTSTPTQSTSIGYRTPFGIIPPLPHFGISTCMSPVSPITGMESSAPPLGAVHAYSKVRKSLYDIRHISRDDLDETESI